MRKPSCLRRRKQSNGEPVHPSVLASPEGRDMTDQPTARTRSGGSQEAGLGHVLLIEDDPRVREIVERGLGDRGFTFSSAPDGESGLDLVAELDVDLLLLDLILPDMNGL